MSAALDIATHLASEGVGTLGGSSSWSIFYGSEPPSPDDAITVYLGAGQDPLLVDENLRRPSVQIRARSSDHEAAHAKLEACRDILAEPLEITIDGTRYAGLFLQGDILSIGRDDSDRFLLTANFNTIRQTENVT